MSKTTKTVSKPSNSKPASASKAKTKIVVHANGAEFSESRPGVLAYLVQLLLTGKYSKSELLAKCVKNFPDRDAGQMKSTIAMQIPSGMFIEKGYVLTHVDDDDARRFTLTQAARIEGDAWRAVKRTDEGKKLHAKLVAKRDDARGE